MDSKRPMDYDRIIRTIEDTHRDEWEILDDAEHPSAFFKADVNLRIVMGEKHPGATRDKWATCHDDSSASTYTYNVFYNSTRIRDVDLVWVNGHRGLLPFPYLDSTPRFFDFCIACIFCDGVHKYMRAAELKFPQAPLIPGRTRF